MQIPIHSKKLKTMIKGYLKESGAAMKLVQLIIAFFVILIFTSAIVTVATNNDMSDIRSLKIMQLIQAIGMFILPPLTLAYLWSETPLHYLRLSTKLKFSDVLLVVFLMMAAIPFINLITMLNQQLVLPEFLAPVEAWMKASELQIAEITEKMLNVHTPIELLFNILLIAVVPALGEELFFRGTIQKIFTERRSAVWGIWIAAFVFSAIHLQFYGFIPRMLLGAFFGYLLFWSESLWLPIIAHFVNNAVAVIFYYLKYNGVKVPDVDTIGTGNTLWLGVLSGILVFAGIYALKKRASVVAKQ